MTERTQGEKLKKEIDKYKSGLSDEELISITNILVDEMKRRSMSHVECASVVQ